MRTVQPCEANRQLACFPFESHSTHLMGACGARLLATAGGSARAHTIAYVPRPPASERLQYEVMPSVLAGSLLRACKDRRVVAASGLAKLDAIYLTLFSGKELCPRVVCVVFSRGVVNHTQVEGAAG